MVPRLSALAMQQRSNKRLPRAICNHRNGEPVQRDSILSHMHDCHAPRRRAPTEPAETKNASRQDTVEGAGRWRVHVRRAGGVAAVAAREERGAARAVVRLVLALGHQALHGVHLLDRLASRRARAPGVAVGREQVVHAHHAVAARHCHRGTEKESGKRESALPLHAALRR